MLSDWTGPDLLHSHFFAAESFRFFLLQLFIYSSLQREEAGAEHVFVERHVPRASGRDPFASNGSSEFILLQCDPQRPDVSTLNSSHPVEYLGNSCNTTHTYARFSKQLQIDERFSRTLNCHKTGNANTDRPSEMPEYDWSQLGVNSMCTRPIHQQHAAVNIIFHPSNSQPSSSSSRFKRAALCHRDMLHSVLCWIR